MTKRKRKKCFSSLIKVVSIRLPATLQTTNPSLWVHYSRYWNCGETKGKCKQTSPTKESNYSLNWKIKQCLQSTSERAPPREQEAGKCKATSMSLARLRVLPREDTSSKFSSITSRYRRLWSSSRRHHSFLEKYTAMSAKVTPTCQNWDK